MAMTRYSHLLQEFFQENMKNHDNEYVFGIISEKSIKGLKSLPKKETLRKIVISWQ